MKKLFLALIMMLPMAAMAQAKFGHVNTQEIMQAMPETKAAQQELETLQKQYETDFQEMQNEFQKKLEDYQKNGATLPDNIKDRREKELQELDAKLRQRYQDIQQELTKAESEKMQAVQTKLLDAVKAVGQEGGYVYIMQVGALPYISTTLSEDVTAKVKAKLGLK